MSLAAYGPPLHLLRCSVSVFEGGYPRGTATRWSHPGAPPETLCALSSGEIRELIGATGRGGVGLRLGGLQLFTESCGPLGAAGEDGDEPYIGSRMIRDPTWCSWSQQVYFMDGQAVLVLRGTLLSLVAGCLRGGGHQQEDEEEAEAADGAGDTARFSCARFVTSDHAGSLYLADCARLCRVALPRSWRAGGAALDSAYGGHGQPAAAHGTEAAEEEEAVVTTLLVADSDITGLAFVPAGCGGSSCGPGANEGRGNGGEARDSTGRGPYLLFSTDTAIYRLPLEQPPAATATAAADTTSAAQPPAVPAPAPAPAPAMPELLAGRADAEGNVDAADGAAARFSRISGICVDAGGTAYVTDHRDDGETTALRRVTPGGAVSTVAGGAELEGQLSWPSILPGSGYLCLCSFSQRAVVLVDLGLAPPACMAGPGLRAGGGTGAGGGGAGCGGGGWDGEDATLGPFVGADGGPPRSLTSDLCALLESQPDATSDLTLRVGGRSFAVHRAILAARCDYFRQRLAAGTFADGAAAELELPDADADAFALLLRWLYTGAVQLPAVPTALHALAELADRLLLPELCHEVQNHILRTLAPETVVEHLVWAERMGGEPEPASADPADPADPADAEGSDDAKAGCSAGGHADLPRSHSRPHPQAAQAQAQAHATTPFSLLLSRLRAWYVARHLQVMETAPDAVRRLMVAAPDLAFQLHLAAARRAAAGAGAGVGATLGPGSAAMATKK
ncbi:hypothetical protein HYH02_000493 [Chlamydomonas schloesseri]|uniref:BTB domain-containing protein n=1 Tax=Chlamydomonas schloesseri TaxID=2026947 RepID=A0A835WWU9_9CHLO|nr:hypothetical protein HYH02_000493 [Chlamydomonas schloesseri]|eukprot:KAG2454653.1 hypothetical protein HYH02_000493 [Chlamydomonas schloesseri]